MTFNAASHDVTSYIDKTPSVAALLQFVKNGAIEFEDQGGIRHFLPLDATARQRALDRAELIALSQEVHLPFGI